jgi:hypothetical protein
LAQVRCSRSVLVRYLCCGSRWGLTVRDGYQIGADDHAVYISNGDQDIATAPHTVDGNYHTYRVEVVSNSIRLLIDGQPILEVSDNKYLNPGRVGFFSSEQIAVRSMRVEPLP